MSFNKYLKEKKAFVFELDNVLYPEKDYLLQVYYLFAQFIEYSEQISAAELIKSMQQTYFLTGNDHIFDKTAEQFNIPLKYKVNFDMLLFAVRLPLKLQLFKEIFNVLQEIVAARKQIFLLTNGDPDMQLNKIKQMEWEGLEDYLKVYFAAETLEKPSSKGLELIMIEHTLKKEEVLLIGKSISDQKCAEVAGVDFLKVDKLLLP